MDTYENQQGTENNREFKYKTDIWLAWLYMTFPGKTTYMNIRLKLYQPGLIIFQR